MLDRDPARRARYSQGAGIYRILPAAVARPETLPALRGVLAEAAASGWPVTPRGAGSAMDGGNLGDGVVIDLSRFEAGRCEIDPAARLARVTPSLPLAALNAAAAEHGLRLPPDPSSGAWATLGGMVGTNASGARTVRYGSVRPWVQRLTLLTDDGPLDLARGVAPDPRHPVMRRWNADVAPALGERRDAVLARYPAVRKNSAGYALDHYLRSGDPLDLVIGAEGTLGVVTDITWRLDAVPAHRASLRIVLRDRLGLSPAIEAIRAYDPSTLEFLDGSFLALIDRDHRLPDEPASLAGAAGLLLADLEGDDAAEVAVRAEAAGRAAGPWARDVRTATGAEEIAALWAVRHGASPALARLDDGRRSLQVVEDGCVPPDQLTAYLQAVDAATARAGVDAITFGHAGDGHLHVNLLPDLTAAGWEARVAQVYHEVNAAAIALGGTPSGEHGTGRLRAGLLEALYGAEIVALFGAVKRAFDPAGRWNPGVLLPDGADPLTRLKVGRDAAALPDGAAEWLRALEGGARWGTPRWDPPG